MKKVIIAHHVHSPKEVYFWEFDPENVGPYADYAVVENKQGIAIVKVDGIATVNDHCRFGHRKVIRFVTLPGDRR